MQEDPFAGKMVSDDYEASRHRSKVGGFLRSPDGNRLVSLLQSWSVQHPVESREADRGIDGVECKNLKFLMVNAGYPRSTARL